MKCIYCSLKIDIKHDLHYYCNCENTNKVVCKTCFQIHSKCSTCNKKLIRHNNSYTKKVLYSPSTRKKLGF